MAKPAELLAPKKPKLAIIYTIGFALALGAVGLVQWIDELASGWLYLLGALLMLGLGLLHARLMYRWSGQVSDVEDLRGGVILTVQLLLAGGLVMVILYRMVHLDVAFITVLLFFPIPYVATLARFYLDQVPASMYKLWFYPEDQEMPDLDFVDLSQIEVVQFVFLKRREDPSLTNFTSKAPLDMSLAQLFFIFINDYNEKNSRNTIQFVNEKNLAYGWLFYRRQSWPRGRHYFDPDQSFRQNAIQPNELIYAERVAVAEPVVETTV